MISAESSVLGLHLTQISQMSSILEVARGFVSSGARTAMLETLEVLPLFDRREPEYDILRLFSTISGNLGVGRGGWTGFTSCWLSTRGDWNWHEGGNGPYW